MANEFKIKKGLIVTGASGGTVVDIQGSQGQLFSVTDNLSGSIFAVSDISGVPIFDVNSSGLSTFDGNVNLPDNNKLLLGTGNDLEIYHNGSDSYIKDAGAGDLRIVASKTRIYDADLSHLQAQFTDGGSVDLYYSGNKKFETTSTGVTVTGSLVVSNDITATGDLDIRDIDARNLTLSGKGTSAATITSDGSSTLTTKGYVNSLITGATIYRGTWDPDVSLNSGYGNPNLNTVTQTSGYYYICSADGAATPNGATTEPNTWNTGDWVIWNDDVGTSGEWQKIDNSSVLSGVGTGQTVALWEGPNTVTDSETLGNAPITVSGSDTTFAGNVILDDGSGASPAIEFINSNNDSWSIFNGAQGVFNIREGNIDRLEFAAGGNATFAGTVTVGTGIINNSIGGDIAITQGAIGLRINDSASAISPTTASANNDNAVDLGVSNIRFKNLYLGGSITSGGGATFAGNITVGDSHFIGDDSNDNLLIQSSANENVIINSPDDDVLIRTAGTTRLQITNTLATFSGLVSGITPVNAANFVTKAYVDGSGGGTGPFLPLAGGTLTGALAGTSASFTGSVTAGSGSGSVALTVNDGGGNANVTFNHANETPDVNGNSFRIRANVDSSSGAAMVFELKEGVTAGTQVTTLERFRIDNTGAKVRNPSSGVLDLQRDDTSVVASNALGKLRFMADDPTNGSFNIGAEIKAKAEAAWSTDDYPSRLEFYTTTTDTSILALTIDKDQDATFAGSITFNGTLNSTGNLILSTASAGANIEMYTDGNMYYDAVSHNFRDSDASPTYFNITASQVNSFVSLAMNNYKITTLATPTNAADAATKAYVDAHGGGLGPFLPLSAGSSYPLTGDLYTGTFAINTRRLNISSFTAGAGLVMNYGNASGTVEFISLQSNGVTSPIKLQMRQSPNESDLILAGSSGNGLTLTSASNALFAGKVAVNGTSIFADAELDVLGDITLINRNWALRGNNSNADFVIEKVAGNNFNDNNIAVTVSQFKNVGIGTTSPSQKLHVHSTSSDGMIRVSGDNILNSGGEIKGFNNGFAFNVAPSGGGTYVERMRINGLGNVGIGTSTLNAISGTNPTLTLGGTGISGGLILQRAGTDKARLYENAGNMVHQGMTGVGHHFYVNAVTQAMVIDTTGNVGIGEDTPNCKLDVKGAVNTTVIAATTLGDGGGAANRGLAIRTDTDGGEIATVGTGTNMYLNTANNLYLQNASNTKVTMLANGNVGIGVTGPGAKLDVDGSIRLSTSGTVEGRSYPYTTNIGSGANATTTYIKAGSSAKTEIELSGGDTNSNIIFKTPTNPGNVTTVALTLNDEQNAIFAANVGIGTTTPLAKLDIQGTQGQLFSVTDDLSGSIFAVSDISGVPIFDVNSSGVSYFDGNVGINVTNPGFQSVDSLGQIGIEIKGSKESNTAPCLRLHETGSSKGSFELRSNRNAATSGNYFAIAEGTDTFFTIRGDDDSGGLTTRGNVGIGTTSPAAKLVVSDGTQAFSVNPHSTGIDLHSTGNLAPHYQTDFTLYTGAIGSGSARVTVNSAGNVGIGATSPIRRLDVIDTINGAYGTSTQQFVARFFNKTNDSTVNSAFISLQCSSDNEGSNPVAAIGVVSEGTLSNNGACVISTRSGGGILERMRISSAGAIKFNAYGAGTLVTDASGNITAATSGAGTGTVTSITKGNGLVVAGSPITTTGSVAVEYAGNVNNIITGGNNFIGDTAVLTDQILITNPGVTSTNRRVGNIELGDLPFLPFSGGTMTGAIIIPEYITHAGDTDTKFGFTAANQFQVIAGGNTNLNVQGNGVDLSYAGSTKLTTQTGGIAITGDLTVTADVGIGLTNPDVPLHVTANEDGSGIDKGSAKFINTNTGQGATTMHMVQTSSSNFANAVKFWQGSTPTAVGFIRLTTSATQFITSASDLNLKKNITNWSDDTLSKFKALEPKKFRFKTQDVSEDKTLGFIAQNEVDNFPEAYPQFLGDDEKPYYGFNPTGMVPHLMKAIKDLVEKVEILENKITQLENNN